MSDNLTYNRTQKGFLWTTQQVPPFPKVLTTGKSCCCCACCKLEDEGQTYTCTDGVPQAECLADGGEKKCVCPTEADPDRRCTCEDEPCCNGACCTEEGCEITADVVCAERGGDFRGCGQPCCACATCDEANPCEAPCVCVNGQCEERPDVPCAVSCLSEGCYIEATYDSIEGSRAIPGGWVQRGSEGPFPLETSAFINLLRPGLEDLPYRPECFLFVTLDSVVKDSTSGYEQVWYRSRLFSVDCDSGEIVDVSDTASYGAIEFTGCVRFGQFVPPAECPLTNPGFVDEQEPQLICPP